MTAAKSYLALAILRSPISEDLLATLSQQAPILGVLKQWTSKDGLTILAFQTELKDFQDENSQTPKSLDWAIPRVMGFERCLRTLGERVSYWPFGFPCLFSDKEKIETLVHHNHEKIESFFFRYKNCQEYNLLVEVAKATPKTHPRETLPSGLSYLKAKQEEKLRAETSRIENIKKARFVTEILEASALDWKEKKGGALFENPDLIAHFVFSATMEEALDLESKLQSLQDGFSAGMKIEITGPWPLMSFITNLEEDRPDLTPSTKDNSSEANTHG